MTEKTGKISKFGPKIVKMGTFDSRNLVFSVVFDMAIWFFKKKPTVTLIISADTEHEVKSGNIQGSGVARNFFMGGQWGGR